MGLIMVKQLRVKRRALVLAMAAVFPLLVTHEGNAGISKSGTIEQPEGNDDTSFIARAIGM